jgi:hypothetical protein
VDFSESADETILDEIIGADNVPRQNARIAFEAGDQGYDFVVKILIGQTRFWRIALPGPIAVIAFGICFLRVQVSDLAHPRAPQFHG